tara:strand:- start:683 stop:859 length:177 start_codon:yes stop_codon:yes gene_type:complete
MRTKWQQAINQPVSKDAHMIKDLKSVATRSQGTLVQDMIGAIALLVILLGGLSLPALV